MPSRLRLFVKKRGKRRTSAAWQGTLGEALLDAALLVIGSYGLYWLTTRFLLAEDSASGWWPKLAIVVPLSLLVYGGAGLAMLLWQSATSAERRSAVAQRAADWELPGGPPRPARPLLPTVPPIDAVVDSPGVQLAYRLPLDAASGWVTATMAVVCLAWNTLVAIFVIQVVRSHLTDEPNWLLTWLMAPLVMAGLWTLVALVRQVWMTIVIGATRLEISDHPLRPGGRYEGFVSQTGRLHARWLQVQLICEEQAIYQQGTDTRRATARVFRETVLNRRKFDITPGQAFEARFSFALPANVMHSFASTHNAVQWSIVVRGRLARWGELERQFPVYVYPQVGASG
jgi:hypothetical protein